MGLYTKKPVTIEAIQYRAGEQPSELADDVISGRLIYLGDGRARIDTLEGVMFASPGDWIIRGVKGELYPCKPDIFEATYALTSREADATGKPVITRAEADASLASAPVPRITVDSMEAKVSSVEYFRSKTLTICILTLANGFTIVGKSACASPENYNQALGERYAYDDAFRQIWAFEGYLLREKLAAA